MEVNIIEDEPKSLILEVNCDRAVVELIRGVLSESKDIEFVSVAKGHPEIGKPRLIIKGDKPKAHVAKAIEEVEEMLDQVSSKLKK